MIKRIACVLLLLPAFMFCAQAVPTIDGAVAWAEYGQRPSTIIPTNHESNNEVSAAYLCQCISLDDYSVYVGVRYVCEDVGLMLHPTETGDTEETADQTRQTTGITVWFNGEKCCTAYFDGTVDVADRILYDADAAFRIYDDTDTDNPQTNNFDGEVRLGVKQGIPFNSRIGLQILDCSGMPSNLYTFTVNPEPTSAESTTEQTASRVTSESKSETKAQTKTTAARPTDGTTASKRTSVGAAASAAGTRQFSATGVANTALTLGEKPQTTSAAAAVSSVSSVSAAEKKSGSRTTAGRKAAAESTRGKRAATAGSSAAETEMPTTAARTESDDRSTAYDVLQASKRVSAFSTAKLVGIILTAVLLTAAVMTSAFIGVQKRGDPSGEDALPTEDPEQEPDDF